MSPKLGSHLCIGRIGRIAQGAHKPSLINIIYLIFDTLLKFNNVYLHVLGANLIQVFVYSLQANSNDP